MILNNYYNMCKQLYTQFTPSNPDKGTPVILTNGSSSTGYGRDRDPLIFCLNSIASTYIKTTLPGTSTENGLGTNIVFGTNDTPPTPDDFTTDAISNINFVSGSISNVDSKSSKVEIIFKNNNKSAITIKDVLICSNASYGTSTSVRPAIFREVFPQPITVEAGQNFTFKLTKSYGD